MKKILLLVLTGIFLSGCEKKVYVLDRYATMRAEELIVPAAAKASDLLTVDFVSPAQGFVGGTDGTLLATADGGQNWQNLSQPTLGTIRKLAFTSATAGWAATGTGLYRTTNGGQGWQRVANATTPFNDVQFVTPQVGYAVGSQSQILKTTNGGQTWQSQRQSTWKYVELRSVSFSAPDSGMAVGNHEAMYTTTNGGQTWLRRDDGISNRGYNAVLKYRQPDHFLLLGQSDPGGLLYYSSFLERSPNGDNSPEDQNTFTMYGVARLQNRTVAVGENTIIRYDPAYSGNVNTPWTLVHAPDGTTLIRPFRAVDFADLNTLYAVGTAGLLMRLHY